MKRIVLYKNLKGECQIENYLRILALKNDKDSRINAIKIKAYFDVLSERGIKVGYPYVKHIAGKIWELRPLDNRILFFENTHEYVMLHLFVKNTQKTPKEEILKATKEMFDYIKRKEIKK